MLFVWWNGQPFLEVLPLGTHWHWPSKPCQIPTIVSLKWTGAGHPGMIGLRALTKPLLTGHPKTVVSAFRNFSVISPIWSSMTINRDASNMWSPPFPSLQSLDNKLILPQKRRISTLAKKLPLIHPSVPLTWMCLKTVEFWNSWCFRILVTFHEKK